MTNELRAKILPKNKLGQDVSKKHIKIVQPLQPAVGSSVKRSENWSRPIPSIGLGRQI